MFRLRVFAILFFLVSFCMLVSSVSGVGSDEALIAIDRADSAIVLAYRAVLEAEGAGANVSGLLEELNFGAEALATANMLYRVGNFGEAVNFADLCYDSVVDVAAKADEAVRLAEFEGKGQFYVTSAASTLGVCCVVLGGVFGWRVFKRRYFRRVLETKPEVVSNES